MSLLKAVYSHSGGRYADASTSQQAFAYHTVQRHIVVHCVCICACECSELQCCLSALYSRCRTEPGQQACKFGCFFLCCCTMLVAVLALTLWVLWGYLRSLRYKLIRRSLMLPAEGVPEHVDAEVYEALCSKALPMITCWQECKEPAELCWSASGGHCPCGSLIASFGFHEACLWNPREMTLSAVH